MADKYYSDTNAKLMAQRIEEEKKTAALKNEDEVTDDLLFYYDKNFNNNYDTIQNLNNTIETRDAIITTNQDSYDNKGDIIFVLKYMLYFVIFVMLVFVGSVFGIYSTNGIIGLLVLGILLFFGLTYYKFYFSNIKASIVIIWGFHIISRKTSSTVISLSLGNISSKYGKFLKWRQLTRLVW